MTNKDKAQYIADYCEEYGVNLAESEADWWRIAYTLATDFGEGGREIFHRISRQSKKYRLGENEYKYNKALQMSRGDIHLATLIQMAADAGIQIPREGSYTPIPSAAKKKIPPTPTPVFREIPPNWVEATICRHDALSNYLSQRLGAEAVDTARRLYKVGTTKHGETIFYLADEGGRCYDGKLVQYSADGHRMKEQPHRLDVDWLHRRLRWDMLSQTLFGVHLLQQRPDAPVALVEAEKTALVGSILAPAWVWIACGGEGGFTEEKLRPLQGRKVYIFPDRDAVEKWREKAPKLLPAALFIGDWYVGKELGEKADLADWWLQAPPVDVPQLVLERYPDNTALHRLCDVLGLDLVVIAPHTDADENGFKTWKDLMTALGHRA